MSVPRQTVTGWLRLFATLLVAAGLFARIAAPLPAQAAAASSDLAGLGAALFTNGHLFPNLELGHHIWRKKGMTYEDYLGRRGLDKFGKKEWNKLLQDALKDIEALFNYDRVYLGGGNTKKIDFKLPANVTVVSNESGILGGVYLWRDQG